MQWLLAWSRSCLAYVCVTQTLENAHRVPSARCESLDCIQFAMHRADPAYGNGGSLPLTWYHGHRVGQGVWSVGFQSPQ